MQALVDAFARIAEIERKLAGMVRHGTVAEVDPGKGLMRLKLGTATGGGDMLGPWVPYSQSAGALKAHIPPAVGQQFSMISPSGDFRQAVAVPLTWSNANGAPSNKGDENVITYGDIVVTMQADALRLAVGGVSLTISGNGIEIEGGRVRHNGKNIGDTHVHGGIERGGSRTDPPS